MSLASEALRVYTVDAESLGLGVCDVLPGWQVTLQLLYVLLYVGLGPAHRRRKMLEVEGALDINAREIFGHAHFYQNPVHLGVLAMLLEYIGTIF